MWPGQSTSFRRARRNAEGKAEIAYGHHRLAALQKIFPPTQKVQLIIRPLSDAMMLQMMVRENNESYKTSISVLLESIRATVQAYAEGKVSSEEMPVGDRSRIGELRYAPSFQRHENSVGCSDTVSLHPYTVLSIGLFIGMTDDHTEGGKRPKQSLRRAMNALELMEQGYLKEKNIVNLSKRELEAELKDASERRDLALGRLEPRQGHNANPDGANLETLRHPPANIEDGGWLLRQGLQSRGF
jgi:hypothetical protein